MVRAWELLDRGAKQPGSIQEPYFFSKVLMPEEEEKGGRSEATVLLQGIWLLQQTRDYG